MNFSVIWKGRYLTQSSNIFFCRAHFDFHGVPVMPVLNNHGVTGWRSRVNSYYDEFECKKVPLRLVIFIKHIQKKLWDQCDTIIDSEITYVVVIVSFWRGKSLLNANGRRGLNNTKYIIIREKNKIERITKKDKKMKSNKHGK